MKSLLAPQNLPALRRLARGRVLLAFDFDGTLAPIVADPARAHLRPRTRRLLADVARKYPCVVISGRRRADVVGRLAGIPFAPGVRQPRHRTIARLARMRDGRSGAGWLA
jgi:hypothetical protein